MSYSITIIGRDKTKLKAAVRAQQCKDEDNAPHNGVPAVVVDRLCAEIDRVRIYDIPGRTFGLKIEASGSFHESGCSHTYNVQQAEVVE